MAAAPLTARAAGGTQGETGGPPPSELSVAMTLYAGGIALGKVALNATIRGTEYHAVSDLETSGIINALWKETIQATSSGRIVDGRFQPSFYDSFAIKPDNSEEEVSLTYEGKGPPHLYVNPPFEDSVKIVVPDAEQMEALDPVSAISFMTAGLGAHGGNPCDAVAHVFDGRRRYDIAFTKEGDVHVEMDNGLYKGPAITCRVEYRQVSGAGQHVIEQASSLPVAHAWIASFPSAIAHRAYLVPLRLWAKTPYGTVAAVATSLSVDGAAPKSSGN